MRPEPARAKFGDLWRARPEHSYPMATEAQHAKLMRMAREAARMYGDHNPRPMLDVLYRLSNLNEPVF